MKQVIAVDALIVRDGRILLTKRSGGGLSLGCWTIPRGGVELGEVVEGALAREIKEELNLELVSYRL
ncbi:MAG TPA: NUDIX domain-containing protein [Patescibacteria group bacterium]|nr:NUDIX domain-containing protein [Patescibacteria group bacterium]